MAELKLACMIVAVILAVLAALLPLRELPAPYSSALLAGSLAFGWLGHLL